MATSKDKSPPPKTPQNPQDNASVAKLPESETLAPPVVQEQNPKDLGGQSVAEEQVYPPNSGKMQEQFFERQRERLLALKDTLLDSMNGVAKDSLRSRAEGSEASAFGMHQADAGSDAYDRDFALSLLSQEQDSLYEIDEALKRLDNGTYGTCEMSGKPIPQARLEALPFTRYTVECQAELEKRSRYQRHRQPVSSLFGLTDEEGGEGDEEDSSSDQKE
ncbi:MAG: molecular chaperone DnaK [Verrucomicrobia bacterium]|nr:MAG: molecular chaperone DnaK [Verrucomicrobiota bacterium]